MSKGSELLKGYNMSPFSHGKIEHDVYEKGEGPCIVLIQELPGIEERTIEFANRLVKANFKVVLPHMLGPLGKKRTGANTFRILCINREFRAFAAHKSSPIVDWLKALCQKIRSQNNVKGVGVIGMCLTGNFAISLMADDSVLGAVASQPSMPFLNKKALHMSANEIKTVKKRIDEVGPMWAFRFREDWRCPPEKFCTIDETFNQDGHERIKLVTLQAKGHSVFTHHFDLETDDGYTPKDAYQDLIDYFTERLKSGK